MIETITIKLAISMIGVLFFLKFSGKSQMSQISPLNMVNNFVLGALIGGTIYSPKLSVWFLVYAIAFWTFLNYAVNYFSKYMFFRKVTHGNTEYIIRNGMLNLKALKKNNLTIDQMRTLLREKDIYSLLDIDNVRFETDGQLTVSRKREVPDAYLFINDGNIDEDMLKDAQKTGEWLKEELAAIGETNAEDIYCAEWTAGRGFYVVHKDGKINYHVLEAKRKHEEIERKKESPSELKQDFVEEQAKEEEKQKHEEASHKFTGGKEDKN
ncbi:putative membrane protein YcaP [Parelusimicrobium proximum]|uniref:DUF421 domain-containing protein n=1 Tax=Parelusimicrobium proximum TaxID=3228953 RepID=UPI003D169B74